MRSQAERHGKTSIQRGGLEWDHRAQAESEQNLHKEEVVAEMEMGCKQEN